MSGLTREQIFDLEDIQTKKIHVPIWERDVFIRQLTRGQQDEYLKRQFGNPKLKQERGSRNQQEVSGVNIYGHDAFLCTLGIVDEKGDRIFTEKDIPALKTKNGEAVGFIAREIVIFSSLEEETEEIEELEELKK